jgi:hypothetical protein
VCEIGKKILCQRIDIFTAFLQHKLFRLLCLRHRKQKVLVVVGLGDLEVLAFEEAIVHVVFGLLGLGGFAQLQAVRGLRT